MASNGGKDIESPNNFSTADNSKTPDPCVQPDEVTNWLNSFNFGSYAEEFIAQGYDSLFVCSHLEEKDLDLLKITKPGHRKTLLLQAKILESKRNKIEEVSDPLEIIGEVRNRSAEEISVYFAHSLSFA